MQYFYKNIILVDNVTFLLSKGGNSVSLTITWYRISLSDDIILTDTFKLANSHQLNRAQKQIGELMFERYFVYSYMNGTCIRFKYNKLFVSKAISYY